MAQLTVRFFEILSKDEQQFPDIDVDGLLDAVANMPDQDAYVQLARMELLGSTYAENQGGRAPQCSMIILDRITRYVQMRIENRREYRPLELGENDTIAEPTHIGLFARNVLGIMRGSGQAPSPACVRDFLNTARLLDEEITVKPLVDANALRALSDVGKLTKLSLELDPETVAQVTGAPGFLTEAFGLFGRELPGASASIVLKFWRSGPDENADRALQAVQTLYDQNALETAHRAQIGYRRLEDGRAAAYDFLSEYVCHGVEVEMDEERGGPNPARASEAIRDAYERKHDDILSALNRTRDRGQAA